MVLLWGRGGPHLINNPSQKPANVLEYKKISWTQDLRVQQRQITEVLTIGSDTLNSVMFRGGFFLA